MAGGAESIIELYASRPRVAILMSGSGSNAEAILSDEELRDLYDITSVVTDNSQSNAQKISDSYDLELIENHVHRFESTEKREVYFKELYDKLSERGVKAAFYAGFMKISTALFCEAFPGVNIHPADLTVTENQGLPLYRGMQAMHKMRKDLGFVRSTVHVVELPVDSGSAISLTTIVLAKEQSDSQLHELLKTHENYVYPQTLRLLGTKSLELSQLPIIVEKRSRLK